MRDCYLLTNEFVDCLYNLDKGLKTMATKVLYLLAKNPSHPSLNVEKIFDNVYTARLDLNHRIVHQLEADKIRLLYIGTHDNAYRFTQKLHHKKIGVVREPISTYKIVKKKFSKVVKSQKTSRRMLIANIPYLNFTPTGLIKIINKIQKQKARPRH